MSVENHQPPDASEITTLLRAHESGDREALRRLIGVVYPDLRRVAHGQLGKSRKNRSFDTTDLVHEAYLKLADQTRAAWQDRGHFFAVAATAMRQILVDAARERLTAKRGGGKASEELQEDDAQIDPRATELLALDVALRRLSEIDPRLTQVVECRYFAGYTESETANVLSVSIRTLQRDWKLARSWLRTELSK